MDQSSRWQAFFSGSFKVSVAFFVTFFAAYGQPRGIYALLQSSEHQVLVVAHMADPIAFPENSLEGLRHCINNGIDIAEVDVQRTRDGQLILMHDLTLDRTTTGKGRVSHFDWKHIQRLHLRDRFKKTTCYRIPLLKDALLLAKGRIILNIDKAGSNTKEIMKLVKDLDCGPYVIMKGVVDLTMYEKLKHTTYDDPLFMPIVTAKTSSIDSFTTKAKPLAVEILVGSDTTYLTSENGIQMFRSHGCHLWYNALFDQIAAGKSERKNRTASWDYFIGLGARFIQTDYPIELLNHLVSKGIRSRPVTIPLCSEAAPPESLIMSSTNQENPSGDLIHVVRNGETLYLIARRHNVPLDKLLKSNPGLQKDAQLMNGQAINLPTK